MKRNLDRASKEAERKAWDCLSRYKFFLFGYYSAQWVTLNKLRLAKDRHRNPFHALVMLARLQKRKSCPKTKSSKR